MEVTTGGKRVYSEAERKEIVERYKKSGVRAGEFCEREKISQSALQSWKRKYLGAGASKFIELPLKEEGGKIELKLPCGIVLTIGG